MPHIPFLRSLLWFAVAILIGTSLPARADIARMPAKKTVERPNTRPASTKLSPKPASKTPFNPRIAIDTLAPAREGGTPVPYHQGIFIDKPDGGRYRICGHILNAEGILLSNKQAFASIDQTPYPLVPLQKGAGYSFCGDIEIHALGDENGAETLSDLFNHFTVSVRGQDGSEVSERFSIINSPKRDTEDADHSGEVGLFLNNQGSSGDRANDYLSHALNDLVLSNPSLLDSAIEEKILAAVGGSTDLEKMYDAVMKKKASDPIAEFFASAFSLIYDLLYDIDGDETMTLAYRSASLSGSQLKTALGDTEDDMVRITGTLSHLKLYFDFRHTVDDYFMGKATLETATLVIDLGKITLDGSLRDLAVEDGRATGNIHMKSVRSDSINSWWENWKTYDVWWEGSDSGMDEFDNYIDEHFKNGFSPAVAIDEYEIDTALAEDSDLSLALVPDAMLFSMRLDPYEIEIPDDLNAKFSPQDGYRSTENEDIEAIYEPHQNREIGLAIDDDLANHLLHFATKTGKFYFEKTVKDDGAKSLQMRLNAEVAPILFFDSAGEHAFRLEIANAALALTDPSSRKTATYRLDLSVDLDMFDDGSDQVVHFTLANHAIALIPLSGPKFPDALLERLAKNAINTMLSELESELNARIAKTLTGLEESLPFDPCTELGAIEANGAENALSAAIDLTWSSTVSASDSCFELN